MKTDSGKQMLHAKPAQVPTRTRGEQIKVVEPYRIYGEWGIAIVGTDKQLLAMEAAPELLKALEELAEDADYALKKWLNDGSYSMSSSLALAHAAIQKAEGQQPQGFRE